MKKEFKDLIESQHLIDHFFDYALMITNYSKIDEKSHKRKIFRTGKIDANSMSHEL